MNLLPLNNRIVIKVDTDYRTRYKLTDTIELQMVRNVEQFDERMKNPVNATVIAGRGLTEGMELLLSHHSVHEVNRLTDTGLDSLDTPNIKYYSVPEGDVYMYRDAYNPEDVCNGWRAYSSLEYDSESDQFVMTDILIVKKVFRPKSTGLIWLPPVEIENKLFVVRGNRYEGKVLMTAQYCYYTIYYQEVTGKQCHISRMKDTHWEVEGIANDLTAGVVSGELLIGDTPEDAKTYSEFFKLQTV
jgi:hypothetical protein